MSSAPGEHIWWIASRASGLIAIALVTLSVLLGLAMASKIFRFPGLPRILNALHEQLGVAGLIMIGLHGVTLLGDAYLNPGAAGVAIPFQMDYRPVYTGLGIIGGYLMAGLSLSFYLRKRIGTKLWRKAHRFTLVAWAMSVVHTLGAGTDATLPAVRWSLIASVALVVVMFATREGAVPPARQIPART